MLSGAAKGVNVLFGAQMQQAFGSMGAMSPEQAKVQQEMQAAIAEEVLRFRLANAVMCIAQLVLCGALVYSGLNTLALKDAGRRLFLAVCLCLIFYEIGWLVVFMFQQLNLSPIMELYMPQLMKDPSGKNVGAEQFGQVMARMTVIFGVVVQCVWTLIKFAFFAVSITYLRKAKIIALFDPSPAPDLPKPEPT